MELCHLLEEDEEEEGDGDAGEDEEAVGRVLPSCLYGGQKILWVSHAAFWPEFWCKEVGNSGASFQKLQSIVKTSKTTNVG